MDGYPAGMGVGSADYFFKNSVQWTAFVRRPACH